jgi:hypothetical protein
MWFSFNVNAYQQDYPPWPELAQSKKSVASMQCQTDALVFASLSDNSETRQKLQAALEQLGDDPEHQAEILAAGQREAALKMFAENEAAKIDDFKPSVIQKYRPLHLPQRNFQQTIQSHVSEEKQEAIQRIKEHVIQRDSVARLREMLKNDGHGNIGARNTKQSDESAPHTAARKLPKRVFNSLRQPPRIITQSSESLISLAEKLRHLDVTTTDWASADGSSHFAEDSAITLLHQRLKQLHSTEQYETDHAATMTQTYSLSHSLHNRQRNGGGL